MRDYESYVYGGDRRPVLLGEMYSGQDIVAWHGRIERQLMDNIEEYEAAKNPGYSDKLRAFLVDVWRLHPITGSINVETLDALLTAAGVLAVDPWKMQNYFSNLRDQLRKLKASVEELPLDAFSAAHDSPAPPMSSPSGPEPEAEPGGVGGGGEGGEGEATTAPPPGA